MNVIKGIPEGYEVKTDMFGAPYLQRRQTPLQRRLSELIFLPALLLIIAIVCWILL